MKLKILCVLSLIGSAIGILYGLALPSISALPRAELTKMVTDAGMETSSEQIDLMYALARHGIYYALFNMVEIIGLVGMLTRKPMGFHFYTASQIGCAALLTIVCGAGSITYILWCTLWVLTYRRVLLMQADDQQMQQN